MRAPAPLFLLFSILTSIATLALAQDGGGDMSDGMGGPEAERIDFKKDVRPIFEATCFKCHAIEYKGRKRRPKGSLRLDHKPGILAVVVPGKPNKSALYVRCTLGPDDEDAMPPDDDPLPPEDLKILSAWITQGARFGDEPKGAPLDPAAIKKKDNLARGPSPLAVYAELGKGVAPAAGAAIERARAAGARVSPVGPGVNLLRVEFVANRSKADDKSIKELAALRHHVAILTLSGTSITDRALTDIAKMSRLVRLDLPNTKVTDKGLQILAKTKPPELRRLNLYGTKVTTKGVARLGALPQLAEIFLWKTGAQDEAALRNALPRVRLHLKRKLPEPEQAAGDNNRGRRRRKK